MGHETPAVALCPEWLLEDLSAEEGKEEIPHAALELDEAIENIVEDVWNGLEEVSPKEEDSSPELVKLKLGDVAKDMVVRKDDSLTVELTCPGKSVLENDVGDEEDSLL